MQLEFGEKYGFYLSVAFNQVQLLNTTLRYTDSPFSNFSEQPEFPEISALVAGTVSRKPRQSVMVRFHGVNRMYRKVVYKSRGFCAIFQLFCAASIQVLLLFDGGLYAKS